MCSIVECKQQKIESMRNQQNLQFDQKKENRPSKKVTQSQRFVTQ